MDISQFSLSLEPPLALPHYDTHDVLVVTGLPYMVVSHDLRQCAITLSQLENALLHVLKPLTPNPQWLDKFHHLSLHNEKVSLYN